MKSLYSLIIVLFAYINCQSQTLYNVALVPLSSAPAGFLDIEIKVTFNQVGTFGSSNFFLNIDLAKLAVPALPIVTELGGVYTTNFVDNGGGLISFNIALNTVASATPVSTGAPNTGLSVGVFRLIKLPPSTGVTDIVLDQDFTEVYHSNTLLLNPGTIENALNIALPIIVSNFNVSKYDDRSAKLNWTTTLEINSEYFGIEEVRMETIGKPLAE